MGDLSVINSVITFFTNNLGSIIAGIILIFLAILGKLGRPIAANAAADIIKKSPVTHSEVDAKLLKCQLKVMQSFTLSFNSFRKELLNEIAILHQRINTRG